MKRRRAAKGYSGWVNVRSATCVGLLDASVFKAREAFNNCGYWPTPRRPIQTKPSTLMTISARPSRSQGISPLIRPLKRNAREFFVRRQDSILDDITGVV